jgi:hypothetical protein
MRRGLMCCLPPQANLLLFLAIQPLAARIVPAQWGYRGGSAGTGLLTQMRLIRLLLRANSLSLPAKSAPAMLER